MSATPHPPPTGYSSMAYPPSYSYDLQLRDERIHHLELENVRLQVKLEQAETDAHSTLETMMAVIRMGSQRGSQAPVNGIGACSNEKTRIDGPKRMTKHDE